MRRFFIGLLAGMIAGWLAAKWRLGRGAGAGLMEPESEPRRIALPDLPWSGDDEEREVPAVEPVVGEAAQVVKEQAEDVLDHARKVIEDSEPLLAYCARCRAKRPLQNPEPDVTKDGRPAVRGTCPECGANMFRFVSA